MSIDMMDIILMIYYSDTKCITVQSTKRCCRYGKDFN